MRKSKRKLKNYILSRFYRYKWVVISLPIIFVVVWGIQKTVDLTDDVNEDSQVALSSVDVLYQKALDLAENGDTSGCHDIMMKIAPLSEQGFKPRGYALAHMWIAENILKNFDSTTLTRFPYLKDQSATLEAGSLVGSSKLAVKAQHHLEHAVTLDPGLNHAHLMLATLYIAQDKRNKAISLLVEAIANEEYPHPELHIPLANALTFSGDDAALEEQAWYFLTTIGKEINSGRSNSTSSRVKYALYALILKKNDNAASVIKRITEHNNNGEMDKNQLNIEGVNVAYYYHQALAAGKIAMSGGDYKLVVNMLGKAYGIQPDNELLLRTFTDISKQHPPVRDAIKNLLKNTDQGSVIPSKGKSSNMRHILLSILAEGDAQEALKYAELAVASQPDNVDAIVQLATLLSNAKQPDYDRICEIMETSIAIGKKSESVSSRQYFLYGRALAELSQWNSAIVALEMALPDYAEKKKVHTLLARAYLSVGKSDIADDHKALAHGTK